MTPEQERQRIHAETMAIMRPARRRGGRVAPPRPAQQIGYAGDTNEIFEHLRSHGATPQGLCVIGRPSSPQRYERVMALCRKCPHATILGNGRVVCECVPCRRWRMDMTEQNKHAVSTCPRAAPAFGPEHIPATDKWRWGTGGY